MSRIGIVGVGAIGGYAAACLAHAGHELVLCARRGFESLVVELDGTEVVVRERAVTDPAELDPVDWVFVATKVQHNPSLGGWIDALSDERTRAIVTLQNGVEGHEALTEQAGDVPVVPTVVMVGAEQVGPGHVRHHGASQLIVPAAWAPAICEVFDGTPLTVTAAADFTTDAWHKLVMNAMSGPLCALTLRRLEVFHDPAIEALALAVGQEAVAVAVAAGAALDATTPHEVLGVLQSQPPTMGGSMLYDRLAARPTEHDAVLGPIVRIGRRHGIPAPRCETLLALLDGLR